MLGLYPLRPAHPFLFLPDVLLADAEAEVEAEVEAEAEAEACIG